MTVDDVLPAGADDWQTICETMKPSILAGANASVTFERKDGNAITFDITARALENGRCLAFARDATERQRAEVAVRASEEQLKRILETSPVGVVGTNLDGSEILFTNTRFNELLGRSGVDLVGQDPRIYFANPDDGVEIVKQSHNGERVVDREVKFQNASGDII